MSKEKESWNSDHLKASFSNLDDHDDCQSSSCPDKSKKVTPHSPDAKSKICAQANIMSMNVSRASPSQDISCGITGTNLVSVNDHHTPICEETQPSTDRHLPKEILKLFLNWNERQIINNLISMQDKQDEIWKKLDEKYENFTHWKKRTNLKPILKTFKSEKTEMRKAMEILERSSFGGLILNSKNEILAVQNHKGTWSAPKGRQKIKKNGELEIPWETFSRELPEEMSITLKTMKNTIKLTKDNINDFISMTSTIYLQCLVSTTRDKNDRKRIIGLFFIRIDERNLHFELADKKENQAWAWWKIDDILSNKPELGRDKYYTLRPFVKYLRDHQKL